jgi:hypothetical protein
MNESEMMANCLRWIEHQSDATLDQPQQYWQIDVWHEDPDSRCGGGGGERISKMLCVRFFHEEGKTLC